jgi:hypothetical protein
MMPFSRKSNSLVHRVIWDFGKFEAVPFTSFGNAAQVDLLDKFIIQSTGQSQPPASDTGIEVNSPNMPAAVEFPKASTASTSDINPAASADGDAKEAGTCSSTWQLTTSAAIAMVLLSLLSPMRCFEYSPWTEVVSYFCF